MPSSIYTSIYTALQLSAAPSNRPDPPGSHIRSFDPLRSVTDLIPPPPPLLRITISPLRVSFVYSFSLSVCVSPVCVSPGAPSNEIQVKKSNDPAAVHRCPSVFIDAWNNVTMLNVFRGWKVCDIIPAEAFVGERG